MPRCCLTELECSSGCTANNTCDDAAYRLGRKLLSSIVNRLPERTFQDALQEEADRLDLVSVEAKELLASRAAQTIPEIISTALIARYPYQTKIVQQEIDKVDDLFRRL